MGTILKIFKDFVKTKDPSSIELSAYKGGGSGRGARARIYKLGMMKFAKEGGWDIKIDDSRRHVTFYLTQEKWWEDAKIPSALRELVANSEAHFMIQSRPYARDFESRNGFDPIKDDETWSPTGIIGHAERDAKNSSSPSAKALRRRDVTEDTLIADWLAVDMERWDPVGWSDITGTNSMMDAVAVSKAAKNYYLKLREAHAVLNGNPTSAYRKASADLGLHRSVSGGLDMASPTSTDPGLDADRFSVGRDASSLPSEVKKAITKRNLVFRDGRLYASGVNEITQEMIDEISEKVSKRAIPRQRALDAIESEFGNDSQSWSEYYISLNRNGLWRENPTPLQSALMDAGLGLPDFRPGESLRSVKYGLAKIIKDDNQFVADLGLGLRYNANPEQFLAPQPISVSADWWYDDGVSRETKDSVYRSEADYDSALSSLPGGLIGQIPKRYTKESIISYASEGSGGVSPASYVRMFKRNLERGDVTRDLLPLAEASGEYYSYLQKARVELETSSATADPGLDADRFSIVPEGITTSQKVLDQIVIDTQGQPNYRELNLKVKASEYYQRRMIPIDSVRPDAGSMEGVDPARATSNNPIVLDADGDIIDGRHRFAAAKARGDTEIEALSPIDPPGLDADRFSIAPKGHVAYLNMSDPSSLDQRPHYSEELRERSRDIARGYIDGDKLSANNERIVNPIAEESNNPVDRAWDVLQRTVIGVNDERSFFTKMQDMFSDLSDPVKRKEWFERWRIRYIDKWNYLEKLTKLAALKGQDNRNLLASTNAHSLALLSDRANSVTAAAINNGVLVLRGGIARVDYSKKGLRDSLAPLFVKDKNLYRTWSLWMIANRSARLIRNNKLTNMTVGEIKVVNDRIESEGLLPLFEGVKNDYETWNNYVVDFLKDTGVLNDELAVVFKKYSDYIPFYKNMDIDAEGEAGVSPDMFKQILKAENIDLSLGANRRLNTLFPTLTGQKPPAKLKGGRHQIVDPLVGIMQNLRAAVTSGMRNIASVQVLKDAALIGMATELTTAEEIKTAMYTVRVNGEEKYYSVSDPLLIETLTGFMDGNVKVYPWLSGPAQWLRESVTRSPMFMIRNIQRDSMSAWVTSGMNATPFISTINKFQGTLRGMSGDEKTYNTLEGAGVVGGFDYVFEPKKFEADFRKKLRRSGITPKKDGTFFDSTVGVIWDKLAEVSNKSDSATRQVVYEDTLQNLMSKGVSRVDAESEAIFQAMEVLNFSRRGNSIALRMVAATVPFLNARIQGIDVMQRAWRGQYSSNRKGKLEAQRSFFARGGIIAMATLALAYANNDSEEYKAASDYEQDNFWIIPMPFGLEALKIPIPFEVGLVFKTFPERSARVLLGDELTRDLWDTTLRAVFSTLEVPIFGPQATLPALEVIANHSLFTGRPVESPFLSGKPSEERFNRYTTELAKYAGEKSGFSPIKIQHLIDGYAGTVGSYIVGSTAWLFRQATDAPTVPAWRVDQIPVIGSTFQSAESAQGQISEWTEFYYSVNTIASTIEYAREAKDTKRVERLKRENKKILAVMPKLNRINAKMNKLRTKEDKIWNSRTMDKDKKREELDKIDRRRKVLLADVKEYRKLKPSSFPLLRGILD